MKLPKIEKTGEVSITDKGITIRGFTFNCQGVKSHSIFGMMGLGAKEALKWVNKKNRLAIRDLRKLK